VSADGLAQTIEALLFLSPDPVSAAELADAVEVDEDGVAQALDELERGLKDDGRGVQLRRVAGGYALAAVPEAEDAARRLLAKPRTPPLTQAQAQMEVISAQAELARQQAELRERQLVAEVVKPAEAEAERVRIIAKADAERMRIQAEAAASHDRVALDRMLIDQLPLIVKEAAGGLAGANVNVLNGAEGLSEVAASLVGQGLTILESIKKNLASSSEPPAASSPSDNGSAPEDSPDPAGRAAIEGGPGARSGS